MEWVIGIYLAVGVIKTLMLFGNSNPALKPLWMSTERNPVKLAVYFTAHAIAWPFIKGARS
jgi:hypothetical protein